KVPGAGGFENTENEDGVHPESEKSSSPEKRGVLELASGYCGMKKSWFRKILDWIPDFPGITPASKEFELIDLKNPGKPPRKSRMAGKLLLLLFGTIGAVLVWINTVFNTQNRAVGHVRQAPMELMVSAKSEEGFEAPRKRYTLLVLGKEHDNRADTLIL